MDAIPYKAALSKLFDNGELITYPKNQIVIHAFETLEHLYRLVDGFLKVYSINGRGEEQVHVVYGPGDLFPFTLLLQQYTDNIFYQAMTECRIARLSLKDFEKELHKDGELAYAGLQQSIEQYKVYASRIFSLEYRYARERLAHRLLVLAGRFGAQGADGDIVLRAPLTQQVIASSINLSRETVSREMERFVAKGYLRPISRSGGPLIIADYEGMGKEIPGPLPYTFPVKKV